MIRTIVVPLDGTALAEQALPHACSVARQSGARLVLVRAAPHAGESAMSTSDLRTAAPHLRVTLRDAERYLMALQARLKGQALSVSAEALHTDAVTAILFAARERAADLIVMSTQGRTGMARAFAGSVAEHVLHGTTLPVLLVRAVPDRQPIAEPRPFRTVLVPLDGTPVAEVALSYLAQETVLLDKAAIVLLMAMSPLATGRAGGEQRHYLEAVGQKYLRDVSPDIRVVPGPADAVILEAAHLEDVDLIAMATHGRIGLDRLVHGSVAEHVVHGASVPVLLLHASAAAADSMPATVAAAIGR
jgi:nucleotide-binding universal stress UspA family protein